jgi:hypothetical protein
LDQAGYSAEKIRRGIAATVVLVVALLAGIAWLQRNEAIRQRQAAVAAKNDAEEQARIAESRRLAAESSSALSKYPQRSLLLAVEAVKVEQQLHGVRVAVDEQSLRDALRLIGGRLVARTDGLVRAVAISADNHWLVTASEDKTARLWLFQVND